MRRRSQVRRRNRGSVQLVRVTLCLVLGLALGRVLWIRMGERLASPLGSGELGERLITPPLKSGDSGDENRGELLGLPISACGDRAGS